MANNKKDPRPTKSDSNDGIRNGLRLWLIFLLCFVLLGYPVPLSILLGAAGGLAVALIVAWWKSKDDPSDLIPEATDELDETAAKISGLRRAKQERDARTQKRSSRLLKPFGNFFTGARETSRRSRLSYRNYEFDNEQPRDK